MRFLSTISLWLAIGLAATQVASGALGTEVSRRQAAADEAPTGRGACIQQSGGWVCELDDSVAGVNTPIASSSAIPTTTTSALANSQSEGASTAASTSAAATPAEPSPTGLGECHAHGDHWHCEGEESHEGHDHSHEGHSHSHAGHDHSHAGHSHGPSEEYGCGLAPLEEYNLPLHIGAIFILLAASILGSLLPHVANMFQRRGGNGSANSPLLVAGKELRFILRHFGSGILLSTAFIHLLFHAFVYFNNSCIGTLQYEAASAAIAMAAVYVAFLLDFIGLRSVRRRVWQARQALLLRNRPDISSEDDKSPGTPDEVSNDSASALLDREEFKLNKWSIVSLEAGIIFHSVIIGVTLGAASGEGWVPLLIAIVFHQFCEALGLASRIAFVLERTREHSHKFLKFAMHTCFILSTSLGIAIGVGVRSSFNGNDQRTLLTIGILDSISAGILLYSSLTQILTKDFLESGEMLTCGWARCFAAIFSFTIGLLVMVSSIRLRTTNLLWKGA